MVAAKTILATVLGVSTLLATAIPGSAAEEVNVYSYRQPFLVKPLFDAFTKKTGVKVNVVFAKKGLIERVAQEGANSPADVVLTTDISRLSQSKKRGITQAVKSDLIARNIPAAFRDPDGHWFGLTRRARVVYASRDRVKQKSITYQELADPKWRGKICIRSGQHDYNLGMIASYIAHHDAAKAAQWLKGVKANLARKPSGNDRAQIKGVYAGECDLAIANTYYMGAMLTYKKNPEQKKWANSVRILFPNSETTGTHVNLSGVVLAKHAPNRANGVKLIEFLAGDNAQRIYAQTNFEYPVKETIAWSELVQSWGRFKSDKTPLARIAQLRAIASKLVDKVDFNN